MCLARVSCKDLCRIHSWHSCGVVVLKLIEVLLYMWLMVMVMCCSVMK